MSWLSDLFNPPAANIPLPQQIAFGGATPGAMGYQAPPQQFPTLPPPQNFMPDTSSMAGAAAGAFGGISGLGQYNTYANLYPQYAQVAGGLIGDPNAAGFQQGAGVAAGLGQGAALGAYGAGGGLYGAGSSILGTGFDPQNALYSRTAQQVQDQTRAANAAAGVSTTPYGAGIEGQQMSNFNIDWQNAQLARQAQAIQSAQGAYGQGATMQASAPGMYLGASAMPYQTSQAIGQGQLGTLGQQAQFGAQGAQIPMAQNQQYLQYLAATGQLQGAANQQQLAAYLGGLGGQQQAFGQAQTSGFLDPMQLAQYQQGQQNTQFSDALAQSQVAFNQQQQMFSNMGKLAGGIFGGPIGGAMGGALMGGMGGTLGGGMGGAINAFGGDSGNWASPYYANAYSSPSQLFPGYPNRPNY